MANPRFLTVENDNVLATIRGVLKSILNASDIAALLVPGQFDSAQNIMPVLINDPSFLDDADPLSPAFALNAARLASKLSNRPVNGKIAMVLRPCEIRALVELAKLKQADLENTVIIGIDCPGALTSKDWAAIDQGSGQDLFLSFYDACLSGEASDVKGFQPATACLACDRFVPENADIVIGLFGMDIRKQIMVKPVTSTGQALVESLSGSEEKEPNARKQAVADLVATRTAFRDDLFDKTRRAVDTHEKFASYFDRCINCYNCRVACPVCYCRECVFNTDVFDHDPGRYLQWARRRGAVKLPSDTVFYHMTRLAHMSLSCVGCGQCSNVCPNDIPVMELFRLTASDVQQAFEYTPGKDIEQPLPLSVFKEDEYTDIVGIT